MNGNWILLVVPIVSGLACSDSDMFGPESSLVYDVHVTPSVASPGTTVHIGINVGADSARVRLRGRCAENAEVYRGTELVATLPSPATCPDSVYDLDLIRHHTAQIYDWVIPTDLSPGTYIVRALTLVAPSMEAEAALEVE